MDIQQTSLKIPFFQTKLGISCLLFHKVYHRKHKARNPELILYVVCKLPAEKHLLIFGPIVLLTFKCKQRLNEDQRKSTPCLASSHYHH